MALVRILVDGYSLLHQWPELAPGRPRHSAFARDELGAALTRYHDATGTPVTVFFDGAGSAPRPRNANGSPQVEVLYSRAGQTADDLIERAAARFKPFGEVLVVTDDIAERETVMHFGAHASSCGNFIAEYAAVAGELHRTLKELNTRERRRFNRPRP